MRRRVSEGAYEFPWFRSMQLSVGADVSAPKVAILGAGLMGRWHAHSARRLGAQIVAFADPDQDRARSVAGSGIPVFASAEALFAAVAPDVAHLCSPSASHGQIVRVAIAKGIHVFAEKPLAADAAETRDLCEQAKAKHVQLCPVHQYAFQASVERIIAQRHRIGRPELVDMRFFSAGAVGADDDARPGIAADILPHPIAIAQRLWPEQSLDQVDWSVSPIGSAGWQITAEVEAVTLRITLSLAARPTEASLAFHGDKGAWETDLFHGYARFRDGKATRRSKTLRPFDDAASMLKHASANLTGRTLRRELAYPGLRSLLAAFYASVTSGGPPPIGFEEAIAVADIRDRFLAQTALNKTPRE